MGDHYPLRVICPCGSKKQCLAALTTAALVPERLWALHSDMPLKSDAWLLAVCSSQYFPTERSTVRPDMSHIMVSNTLLVFHSPPLLISVRTLLSFIRCSTQAGSSNEARTPGQASLLFFLLRSLCLLSIDLVTTTRVPSERMGLTALR